MPEPKRPLKVFLCHSSQDKPIVKEIYDRLLSEGWIDPWLDKERLKLGDDFDLEIEKAIESTDAVIAFISKNAVNKIGYIQKELRLVYDAQMYRPDGELFTIPLRLEDCEPPHRFKYWHWGDYFGEEKEKTYQSLLNSLTIIHERVQRNEVIEQARLKADEEERQYIAKKEAENLARLKAKEEERQRIAKEKAEREAASERVSLLRNKFNKVTQLELSGYLEDALNICYEIKAMDRKYPSIEKKIQEIQNAIKLRDNQKKEEERQRIAKEKADREAAEKARLLAEEEERKRIAREKAEHEAAEKAAREKAEKEAANLAILLYDKLNKAIQLERSGYLDEALKIYYEIKSADSNYPNIEKKIQILEKALLNAKEEEQKRIAREKDEANPYREKVRLISTLINQAISLEDSGSLDAALKIYYEVKSIDPRYPTIEKKIQEIENTIKLLEKQKTIPPRNIWNPVILYVGIILICWLLLVNTFVDGSGNASISTATHMSLPITTPAVSVSTSTNTPKLITTPTPLPAEIVDAKGVSMALVPAGEFTMGSYISYADEYPAHEVYLDAFYMDIYEVTNVVYKTCVDSGECIPPQQTGSYTRTSYYGNSEFDDYPVIYVDWNQANTYCEWRDASLPTEAQWEKAARGNDERTYPWGEGTDSNRANFNQNIGDTTEVGSYESGKSPYGMYDMAGNVWEWVADWYAAYPGNTISNDAYGKKYRVLRGGSWYYSDDLLRASDRFAKSPDLISNYIGFRCVRSLP